MKNKSLVLSILMILLHNSICAQGIEFISGLSWKEIKAKAIQEKKYIFLDVKATWCGPCKAMEANVFTKKEVAAIYNDKFLAISVQIDQTDQDNSGVKKWYTDAKEIEKEYAITALPTFLYLSPDGQLVNRATGYYKADDFIKLATTALDPKAGYQGQKLRYRSQQLSSSEKRSLALAALRFNDKPIADSAAKEYYQKLLKVATEGDLKQSENIKFLMSFYYEVMSSTDNYFAILLKQGREMDSLFVASGGIPGASKKMINSIIAKEEINSKLYDNNLVKPIDPDWREIERAIGKKYDKNRAKQIVIDAKFKFYLNKKDFQQAITAGLDYYEYNGIGNNLWDVSGCNNFVWNTVLKYADSKTDLERAAILMKKCIDKEPKAYDIMDTYANILYKAGHKKKALEIEQQALNIITKAGLEDNKREVEIYKAVIDKMKAGLPTWLDDSPT